VKQSDLNKAQQDQLAQAKAMIGQQQAAIDEIREPLTKMSNGKKLTRPEQHTLATVLRWTDEETQAFLDLDDEARELQLSKVLADPYVYFYVGHDKEGANPTHRVYVTGEGVEIQDAEHPDF